ncbi:hypothetical protein [Saccharothrix variisporea]|uniref:PASTA domain-containing protein n=1 Tax=Saccharothrix variisporea TaxID=543527 RepID=A0A495X174_9PSEU|nr:hypothetical protein [Saccharothrix variisporea]RKT67597.1 hypothetical protein DFJ66_0773 [Saccharothrix variisporea]
MNKKVVSVLLALGCTASLVACSSNTDKFVQELKAAGFTNVGQPSTETDSKKKKSKKVGKRTVKTSDTILEAIVRVKGCDLEMEKVAGQSGYWLDELHVNGQEPDWPGYPENPKQSDVVALFAGNQPKPDGFKDCYKPNEP